MKMVSSIERLAVQLIPWRKWMLVAFLLCGLLPMPTTIALASWTKQPAVIFAGSVVTAAGFAWPLGLFLISYLFAPQTGLLTPDQIRKSHPLIRWHRHIMRHMAPLFLGVWFCAPLLMAWFQWALLKMME